MYITPIKCVVGESIDGRLSSLTDRETSMVHVNLNKSVFRARPFIVAGEVMNYESKMETLTARMIAVLHDDVFSQ